MHLPGQDDRNETFQEQWGITCGSAAATISERPHKEWGSTQVGYVLNCSVATVRNKTLSVFCAAQPNKVMPGTFEWLCLESRFFETGAECKST